MFMFMFNNECHISTFFVIIRRYLDHQWCFSGYSSLSETRISRNIFMRIGDCPLSDNSPNNNS